MKEIAAQWNQMSSTAKIITVIVIAIIIYFLVKWLKNKKVVADRIVLEKSEIKVLQESGMKASYAYSVFEGWADELERYMNGAGTDNVPQIQKIFKYLHNDLDFIQLEKAFGLRISSYSWSWFTDPTDLHDWLKGDLGESVIKDINKQLKLQGLTKQIK